MELRGARRADYKAIRTMLKAGVAEGSLQPRKKKEVKRNLSRFVVAEENGSLIGMASTVVYSRRLSEIRSVYVDPAYRGNGVGKELVRRTQEQSIHDLPSSTLIAITQAPQLFESDGFSSKQGQSTVLFKRI